MALRLRLLNPSLFPRTATRNTQGHRFVSAAVVNGLHEPAVYAAPSLDAVDNITPDAVSERHWNDAAWRDNPAELRSLAQAHCVATWGPSSVLGSLPMITRGEGIYVYDDQGKEYMDWTSMAVCVTLGHTVPPSVLEAVQQQLSSVPMVYGGIGLTEVRVRLARLMSELCPADINSFLFPCGGAEANEAAIRCARRFTGRQKIITQYRSYHGGSTTTLGLTGDFRRWFAEQGNSGSLVKAFNPQPVLFKWGATEAEVVANCLAALEEQILHEGPQTIAAIMMESVVGSGGVLNNPPGYMQGVRALCDKYDVLLILDEVMVGFGRTGKFWSFQHYEGVVPDIFTSAKGLSGAWQPVAVVGMRQKLRDFFETNPLGWGATFHAHPAGLACAYAVLKHMLKTKLLDKVQRELSPVMAEGVQMLVDNHVCVKQGRALGMFGCVDLVGPDGRPVQQTHEPNPPAVLAFKRRLVENGIIGFVRPPFLHCAPPLIIEPHELREGFSRVDDALKALDF